VSLGERFPTLRKIVIPHTILHKTTNCLHSVTANTSPQQHRCPNLNFLKITLPLAPLTFCLPYYTQIFVCWGCKTIFVLTHAMLQVCLFMCVCVSVYVCVSDRSSSVVFMPTVAG